MNEITDQQCTCVCHKEDMDKETYQKMCWKCDGTGVIQN